MSQIPLAKPPGYRDPNLPIQRPPPRQPNLPPSFYQHKKRNCCRRCCCCFFIFIVLFGLFLISFGGFFYLWYEPRLPGFELKSFELKKFNITNTPDGPKLDTQTRVTVEFKNNNQHIKLVYDRIGMHLSGEGGLNMGEESVTGFTQGRNNVTVVKFTIKRNSLLSAQDAKKLKDHFANKRLKLTTEMRSAIGMVLSGWNTGTVGVKVICGETSLKQIQDGARPRCRVFMFDLIHIY